MRCRDLSSKEHNGVRSSGFLLCRERVDGDQHRRSLRILDGLQNFEANGFQGLTDNFECR